MGLDKNSASISADSAKDSAPIEAKRMNNSNIHSDILKNRQKENNVLNAQLSKKQEISKQKESPFRKLFKKIHSPSTDTVEATGIDPNDKLISRTQFIVMSGAAPCTFHAVLQKLPNFPKVREIRKHQHFYSVTEVNSFLASLG